MDDGGPADTQSIDQRTRNKGRSGTYSCTKHASAVQMEVGSEYRACRRKKGMRHDNTQKEHWTATWQGCNEMYLPLKAAATLPAKLGARTGVADGGSAEDGGITSGRLRCRSMA